METVQLLWGIILFFLSLLLFFVWSKMVIIAKKMTAIREKLEAIEALEKEAADIDDLTLID